MPRASLASTIKVISGLGYLEKRVLKGNGVIKFDNDKEYTFNLSARFFEFTKSLGETNFHLRLSGTFY